MLASKTAVSWGGSLNCLRTSLGSGQTSRIESCSGVSKFFLPDFIAKGGALEDEEQYEDEKDRLRRAQKRTSGIVLEVAC